jgi:hypothetical protein
MEITEVKKNNLEKENFLICQEIFWKTADFPFMIYTLHSFKSEAIKKCMCINPHEQVTLNAITLHECVNNLAVSCVYSLVFNTTKPSENQDWRAVYFNRYVSETFCA